MVELRSWLRRRQDVERPAPTGPAQHVRGPVPQAGAATYKAFISYSRAVDGKLAPALQSGLHRFAKPWYQRRTMLVFRDEMSLAANPGLWSSIEQALAGSEFFILLASPEAAQSKWVAREASYWIDHKPGSKLFIVMTDGEVVWDDAAGDFDWELTTALPRSLQGAFTEEPRHIDLRWARSEGQLSLRSQRFRDAVVDLAAPLHGWAKEDLVGEDVRQQRRTRWLFRSGLAVLVTLVIGAGLLWVLAEHRGGLARDRGDAVASGHLAEQAVTDLNDDPDLSLLLSIEARRIQDTVEARSALLTGLERSPGLLAVLHNDGAAKAASTVLSVAVSPDGQIVASANSDGMILFWDVATRRRLGQPLTGNGSVTELAFNRDGQTLASANSDGMILFWDVATRRRLGQPLTGNG